MLQPPAIWSLVPLIGTLAALTALADILMDGWGVQRLRPDHASLCQSVGLELGILFASEVFFHLKDPASMELLSTVFKGTGMLSLAIAGGLFLRTPGHAAPASTQGPGVMRQLLGVLWQDARMQHYLWLQLLLKLMGGHVDFQRQRYDALGLTPEKTALYNIWAMPVSFCTAWLAGARGRTKNT